jgi:hypothetical protein
MILARCILFALVTALASPGCHRELAELPVETLVRKECSEPYFLAIRDGDVEKMKSVLSKATIAGWETEFASEDPFPRSWKQFLEARMSSPVSLTVKETIVNKEGTQATVKNLIGGGLKCVKEGGLWRVALPMPIQ